MKETLSIPPGTRITPATGDVSFGEKDCIYYIGFGQGVQWYSLSGKYTMHYSCIKRVDILVYYKINIVQYLSMRIIEPPFFLKKHVLLLYLYLYLSWCINNELSIRCTMY